jgi:hypothetical protein
MSFQITDASAIGAQKISFSARHNHSKCQRDQLALVRKHKIILGPWVSEKADTDVFCSRPAAEAIDYMSGRGLAKVAINQIKAFLEMPAGSVGIIVSKESGTYQTMVVRLTDATTMAGEVIALSASRNAEGKHNSIALAENLAGEKFYALQRKVEILGELSHAEVEFWACEQINKLKPEENSISYRGDNPYVLHIATSKSFDISRKLWLAPIVAEPIEIPVAEVVAPAPQSIGGRILRLESAILGATHADALLLRVRRLEVTLADLHADGFDIMMRVKNLETLAGI